LPPLVTAPLNWNRGRDPESEARVRRRAAAAIQAAYDANKAAGEIPTLLVIGSVCPFTTKWEKEIWLQEVHRICYAAAGGGE
jgi:hypothetical protein